MTGSPLILTVVLPFFISFEKDELGYGTGTGPAGGEGGLRHTSGNAAITLPSPALQAISSPFAYTSQPMLSRPHTEGGRALGVRFLSDCTRLRMFEHGDRSSVVDSAGVANCSTTGSISSTECLGCTDTVTQARSCARVADRISKMPHRHLVFRAPQ